MVYYGGETNKFWWNEGKTWSIQRYVAKNGSHASTNATYFFTM